METISIQLDDPNILDLAKQSAELYSYSDLSILAAVTYKGSVAKVAVVGEMRINYADRVIRRTDELADLGITNDADLSAFLNRDDVEVINNPWYEVLCGEDNDFNEVWDNALDALDYAVRCVEGREDN